MFSAAPIRRRPRSGSSSGPSSGFSSGSPSGSFSRGWPSSRLDRADHRVGRGKRVFYDGAARIFRLYCRTAMYAFHVDDLVRSVLCIVLCLVVIVPMFSVVFLCTAP